MHMVFLYAVVVLYLCICGYLGYLGYRETKNSTDFMVAGRQTHPYIMSLSYGSTFISTSAIIGFGGAAAVFGMGLIWLTFLNIFLGIFIAFAFCGKATRKIGVHLDAHTFPEFLGRRYRSPFIQEFGGILVFLFMPLYTAAVMMGGAYILAETFRIGFNPALLVFAVIVAVYVISGGMKSVMYTDAFQAVVMFIVMLTFLGLTFAHVGGVMTGVQKLAALAPEAIKVFGAKGHQGWTFMPAGGSPMWWELVTTIVMGVGIGVLAQPQLAVRFMTVKDSRAISRAIGIGGVFILSMTGIAFTVGALTNVYFYEKYGKIAFLFAEKAVDKIMPIYINEAMPWWFGAIFLVGMLAAAMSTLSSQIHTMGTAMGHDFFQTRFGRNREKGMLINRLAMGATLVFSTWLSWILPLEFEKQGLEIIARGTAFFFGIAAAAFLPMYLLGIFTRFVTKAGAISGLLTGTLTSLFWIFFVHAKESKPFGLCRFVFGRDSLIEAQPWPVVDPIVIALPLAFLVTILVSLITEKLGDEHLRRCFEGPVTEPHAPAPDEAIEPELDHVTFE